MRDIQQDVINAIKNKIGFSVKEDDLDSTLYDIGIDSLSALEILAKIEKQYNVRVSEEELRNTNTVRDIIILFMREMNKKEERK